MFVNINDGLLGKKGEGEKGEKEKGEKEKGEMEKRRREKGEFILTYRKGRFQFMHNFIILGACLHSS